MSKATAATKKEKAEAKAAKNAPVNNKVKPFEPSVKVLATIDVSPSKLVLTDKFRGRSQPVAQEEVYALAEQLIRRQDQPVQVRPISGTDTYEVIFGNTRTRAGQAIVEGFSIATGSEDKQKEKVFEPIPNFTLRAEVVDVDDEEAVMRNITENVHRVNTSSIDDALNQEMLRTDYGMSDAAITRLYGYAHQASVTQLKKLLTLPPDVQQRIHTNNMTKQAGMLLADYCKRKEHMVDGMCDPQICETLLSRVSGGEDIGNVGSSEIAECIKAYEKEQKQPVAPTSNPDGTPAETPVNPDGTPTAPVATAPETPATTFALTLKEFKDTLTEFAGLPDVSAKMGEFCAVTLSFIKGETPKDAFYDWVSINLQ